MKSVDYFARHSLTRVHCSPPATAIVSAALHALELNKNHGDLTRVRLFARIQYLSDSLAHLGVSTINTLFPMQTIENIRGEIAHQLYRSLRSQGVRTVLHKPRHCSNTHLSILVTARHNISDVEYLLKVIRCFLHTRVPKFRGSALVSTFI
jgi:8-amino-7-oxononanoate synthase